MAPSPSLRDDADRGAGEGVDRGGPPPAHDDDNGGEKSKPKRQLRTVTLALLRKRSEHNDGLVSSLEELALHQEELQGIGPVLGRTCGRTLKILLLQNNVIGRMDPSELKLFRNLEYLNLALNNVQRIEGVGGMEWLRKLDLTLNFVDLDELEGSVDELAKCRSLEELFLLGNPCMGIDNGDGIPPLGATGSGDEATKKIGWKGCRAYVVARLPSLRILDGKEIKRSERIVAGQKLPALALELRSLAEERRKKRQLKGDMERQTQDEEDSVDEEIYISDEAPTYHDPETRTKLSNELHDQKEAKEKQQTERAPRQRGEKEWEEEHEAAVRKAREREERGRGDGTFRTNGGVKQCNQGKYRFWFEEETARDSNGRKSGTLFLRVAVPRHLSTSLIDVDVHPTYASVVVKSKVLRVALPVEVSSDRCVARRSAASGHLELVMPMVDPKGTAVGLGRVGDNGDGGMREGIERHDTGRTPPATGTEGRTSRRGREGLGRRMVEEARNVSSLRIVRGGGPGGDDPVVGGTADEEDEDEPPPLF